MQVVHTIDDNQTLVDLNLNSLNPADLNHLSGGFTGLGGIDLPLSADLTIQMAEQLNLTDLRGSIRADRGQIKFDPILPTAIPVNDLSADLEFDPDEQALIIGPATVTSNGIDGTANIALNFVPGGLDLRVDATAFDMPIDQLKPYWPAVIGKTARDWVDERLSDGMATRADTLITGQFRDGEFALNDITGQISYRGLTVEYINGMTPVTGVNGTADYSKDHFQLNIDGGEIRDSQLKTADIRIEGKSPTVIDINLSTDGPFSDILAIVNEQPFRLADKAGMAPTDVDGNATTDLSINLPIIPDLSVDDITLSAKTNVDEAILRQIALGQSLRSDNLKIAVTTQSLTADGEIELGPLPGQLDYIQYFDPGQQQDRLSKRIRLSGRASQSNFLPLTGAPELPTIVDGMAGYSLNYQEKTDGTGNGDIALELENPSINLPWLNYTKPAGSAASFSADLIKGQGWSIENGQYQSGQDSATLSAQISPEKKLIKGSADIKRLGPNRVISLSVEHGENKRKVTVRGDQMDGRYYFSDVGELGDGQAPSRPISGDNLTSSDIGLVTSVKLGRFITGPEQVLTNLAYYKERNADNRVIQLELDAITGQNPDGGDNDVYIRYLPMDRPDGPAYNFRMEADNAGQTLRRFRWTDKLFAGKLVIDGRTPANPTHPMELTGRAVMDDYRIQRVPVIARLLNALSPGGMIELLNNQGLSFSRLVTDFNWTPQQVQLSDGRTAGQSLGLTFEGVVGLDNQKRLNLNGTVVPIYGVNAMISQIPLLGNILAGQEGEGVFAVTYSITGPLEEAVVTVNPLSALAPGFLRRLFFQGGGTAQAVEADPTTDDDQPLPSVPDPNEAAEPAPLDKPE
jgi:hypothetical protein